MYSGIFAISILIGPQASSHVNAQTVPRRSQTYTRNEPHLPRITEKHDLSTQPNTYETTSQYQPPPANRPIPWWDHNGVGFLIAILAASINGIGIAFIYKQVRANVDAATASIISAQAASRQTELLIAAQRPWLLVKATHNGTGYTFTAHNTGKSPAIIVWRDPFIPGHDIPFDSSLPPEPFYGLVFAEGGELVNPIWVEPGGKEMIGVFDSFAAFGPNARIFVFSVIKYRNTYDTVVHESHFCYRISQGTIALDGPYGYNKYT